MNGAPPICPCCGMPTTAEQIGKLDLPAVSRALSAARKASVFVAELRYDEDAAHIDAETHFTGYLKSNNNKISQRLLRYLAHTLESAAANTRDTLRKL